MSKKRILIVDDEEEIVMAVQARLEANDYEVMAAFDGIQALEKASKLKPDLILLDVNIPVMGGFEIAKRLKASADTGPIPFIFVTAKGDEEAMLEGIGLGAVSYIIKPFTPEQLLGEIKRALQK